MHNNSTMAEEKKLEAQVSTLRLKRARNDMIGNRYMKAQYLAAGLLQEYCVIVIHRCYALLQASEPIDVHIQCMAILNCYIEDTEEARCYLREQNDLFDILLRIFKNHLDNDHALDLSLRLLRNGLIKGVLKVDVFLQALPSLNPRSRSGWSRCRE